MLNKIEEARIAEQKKMCRDLKMPAPPELMIALQVHDKDGQLIFTDIQRGHSWVRNLWNIQYVGLVNAFVGDALGAGSLYIKGTAGEDRTGNTSGYGTTLIAGTLGNDNEGIVVGASDTAWGIDQFIIGTKIANGGATDQLAYQLGVTGTPVYTALTKTWKTDLSRVYNNNSGGLITVKEVALYGREMGQYHPIMLDRSVLSPAVDVADAAQLTVTYSISMDFSAID